MVKYKGPKTPGRNKRERHLNRQQQAVAARKKMAPQKIRSALVTAVLLAGIMALTFQIKLFQNTLIPLAIPLLIALVPSILFIPITRKWLSDTSYNYITSIPFVGVLNVGLVGAWFCSGFMALNFYGSNGVPRTISAPILEKAHIGMNSTRSCAQASATTKIEGQEKLLIFSCSTDLDTYNYVQLTLEEGFFGIDVIKEKTLVNK